MPKKTTKPPAKSAPKSEKKKEEVRIDDLEGGGEVVGGNAAVPSTNIAANISIKKISNRVGPTAPGFDPSTVLHSPNNST